MNGKGPVLISWCARNNDPYERNRDGVFRRDARGERIPGPTLTVLFDPESSYSNRIEDVFLLSNDAPGESIGDEVARETIEVM